MSCWALIPIKALEACKTRLGPALSAQARAELAEAMLRHVVGAARDARGIDKVVLLSPAEAPMPNVALISEPGLGLNSALQYALHTLDRGVTRLIIAAADLPNVTTGDFERLANLNEGEAAIAPDRAGQGTNALSLPLPQARDFSFQFGAGSLADHSKEAQRLGLKLHAIRSETLAFDVDEPGDLSDLPIGLRAR